MRANRVRISEEAALLYFELAVIDYNFGLVSWDETMQRFAFLRENSGSDYVKEQLRNLPEGYGGQDEEEFAPWQVELSMAAKSEERGDQRRVRAISRKSPPLVLYFTAGISPIRPRSISFCSTWARIGWSQETGCLPRQSVPPRRSGGP